MKTSELKALLQSSDEVVCCDTQKEVLSDATKNYILDLETDLVAAKNFMVEFIDLNESVLSRDTAVTKSVGTGFLGFNQRVDILHTIATAQKFLDQWQPVETNDWDDKVLYAD